jgi:hypothetical protein
MGKLGFSLMRKQTIVTWKRIKIHGYSPSRGLRPFKWLAELKLGQLIAGLMTWCQKIRCFWDHNPKIVHLKHPPFAISNMPSYVWKSGFSIMQCIRRFHLHEISQTPLLHWIYPWLMRHLLYWALPDLRNAIEYERNVKIDDARAILRNWQFMLDIRSLAWMARLHLLTCVAWLMAWLVDFGRDKDASTASTDSPQTGRRKWGHSFHGSQACQWHLCYSGGYAQFCWRRIQKMLKLRMYT